MDSFDFVFVELFPLVWLCESLWDTSEPVAIVLIAVCFLLQFVATTVLSICAFGFAFILLMIIGFGIFLG